MEKEVEGWVPNISVQSRSAAQRNVLEVLCVFHTDWCAESYFSLLCEMAPNE
jgi:hypothetical protein